MMKRILAASLVLALLLTFGGCADSTHQEKSRSETHITEPSRRAEEIEVETILNQLGTVTLDSLDMLKAAQAAYDSIPEEERPWDLGQSLQTAWDGYYDLAVAGSWCDTNWSMSFFDARELERMKSYILTLNADHTFVYHAYEEKTGSWHISQGMIYLDGIEYGEYEIQWRDGMLRLSGGFYLCPADWYHKLLDEMFLVVDMEEVDPADYIRVGAARRQIKDEWGDLTESYQIYPILRSKLDETEWTLVSPNWDFKVEVIIPAHQYTYQPTGGKKKTSRISEESWIVEDSGFIDGGIGNFYFEESYSDYWRVSDLEGEDFRFGRAKGTLCFVRSEYAEICNQDGYCYLKLTINGVTQEEYKGRWHDFIDP